MVSYLVAMALGFALGAPAWIIAGILIILLSAYGIRNVEVLVNLDTLYLLRLQSREGSMLRLTVILWLLIAAALAWTVFWAYFALRGISGPLYLSPLTGYQESWAPVTAPRHLCGTATLPASR